MWLPDGLGKVAHFLVSETRAVGAIVEDLQGLDFILVRAEVLFEFLRQRQGFVLGILREAGGGHFVLADDIDHLLVRLLNARDGLSYLRSARRFLRRCSAGNRPGCAVLGSDIYQYRWLSGQQDACGEAFGYTSTTESHVALSTRAEQAGDTIHPAPRGFPGAS